MRSLDAEFDVEAAAQTFLAHDNPRWEWSKLAPHMRVLYREKARCVLRAATGDNSFSEGELRARIEAKAREEERLAERDAKASRTTEGDYFKSESFSMRAACHRIRAEAFRSLLVPKEEA